MGDAPDHLKFPMDEDHRRTLAAYFATSPMMQVFIALAFRVKKNAKAFDLNMTDEDFWPCLKGLVNEMSKEESRKLEMMMNDVAHVQIPLLHGLGKDPAFCHILKRLQDERNARLCVEPVKPLELPDQVHHLGTPFVKITGKNVPGAVREGKRRVILAPSNAAHEVSCSALAASLCRDECTRNLNVEKCN